MKIIVAGIIAMICVLIAPIYFIDNASFEAQCKVHSGDVVTDRIKGSEHVVEEVSSKVFPAPCSVKIDGRWRFGSEFASE